jgi:hypothetical protein
MPIQIPLPLPLPRRLQNPFRVPAASCAAADEPVAARRRPPPATRSAPPPRRHRAALAGALIAAAGILAHAPGAGAQQNVTTRILDACVYDLYFEQRSSERVTERCRCAAGKLASTVTPEEAASYRVGSRLTGTLRDKVYAALNGC